MKNERADCRLNTYCISSFGENRIVFQYILKLASVGMGKYNDFTERTVCTKLWKTDFFRVFKFIRAFKVLV